MTKNIYISFLLILLSGCSILNPIKQADCLVLKVVDYDKKDIYAPPEKNYKTSLIFNSSNGAVYDYDEEFHKKLISLDGITEKNGLIRDTASYIKNDTLYIKKISYGLANKSRQDKVIMVLDLSKKTYYLTVTLLEGFSWRKLYREEGLCKLVRPKTTKILDKK